MFYLLQDQPLDLNAKAILSSLMLQSLTAKDDLKITPEIALHDFQIKRRMFYSTIANLIAKGYLTRTSSSTYSLTDKSIKIISDFKNLLSENFCANSAQEMQYMHDLCNICTPSAEYAQNEIIEILLKRYFNHVRDNMRIESERKIVDFLENFSPYIYIYKYIFNYFYNINNLKKEKKEINKEKKEKIEKIEKIKNRKIEKSTYPQSAVECEPYFESFIKEHKDTYPQLENLNVSLEAQEFFNYYSERSWKDKTHTPVKSVSRRVGTWAKNWAERNRNFKPKAKSFLDQLRAGEVSGLDDIDNKDVLDLDIEELPND